MSIRTTPTFRLPDELCIHTFSYLNHNDQRSVAQVSRKMNRIITDTQNIHESEVIFNWASLLVDNLDDFPCKKKELQEFFFGVRDFRDSSQKRSFYAAVEQKINDLLDEETTHKIICEKTHFFVSTFVQNRLKRVRDESERGLMLQSISALCLHAKDPERAIAIVSRDQNKRFKWIALQAIIDDLIHSGNLDRAIDVTLMIPDDHKHTPFKKISKALVLSGDLKRATEVAMMNETEFCRSYALLDIAIHLVQAGNIDESLSLVHKISRQDIFSDALRQISQEIAKKGFRERALQIARSIPDSNIRKQAERNI